MKVSVTGFSCGLESISWPRKVFLTSTHIGDDVGIEVLATESLLKTLIVNVGDCLNVRLNSVTEVIKIAGLVRDSNIVPSLLGVFVLHTSVVKSTTGRAVKRFMPYKRTLAVVALQKKK